MPIERRQYTQGNGHAATVATACKYCGQAIPEGTGYGEHLRWHCPDSPIQGGEP